MLAFLSTSATPPAIHHQMSASYEPSNFSDLSLPSIADLRNQTILANQADTFLTSLPAISQTTPNKGKLTGDQSYLVTIKSPQL